MTDWSAQVAVDLLPPTPDPMTWATEPTEVRIGTGTFDYYAKMTAAEATDDSGDVEYFFQCTTESGFSSGWQKSRDYSVKVGRSGQRHRFPRQGPRFVRQPQRDRLVQRIAGQVAAGLTPIRTVLHLHGVEWRRMPIPFGCAPRYHVRH